MFINYMLIFIIILIIAFGLLGGYIGSAKIIFAYIVLIVSVFIGGIIDSGVYKLLDTLGARQSICYSLQYSYMSRESVGEYEKLLEKMESEVSAQTAYINKMSVPSDIKQALLENNNSKVWEKLDADKFMEYICEYLAYIITGVISMAVAVMISIIFMCLLLKVSDIIKLLEFDTIEVKRITGAILGVVTGILVMYILLALVPLFGDTAFGESLYLQIDGSKILKALYNNNIIIKSFMLSKTSM